MQPAHFPGNNGSTFWSRPEPVFTPFSSKPEAPWIKRCDYGIKFTDEIQVIEGQPSEEVTETEMTTNKDNEEDDDD